MQITKDQPDTSSRQGRQLAAIMFADMTGYTALMQENEQKAKILRSRQKQTLEKFIPAYKGQIVQYFGDGTLSIFYSGTDAVKAAIDIQKELQNEPTVLLRIGIHTGDVVLDEDGLYGDCVNLASRIETLATPGSIFISDKVYDEVKNQDDIETTYLGKFNLKNVKRQTEVYAVTNDGLPLPTSVQLGAKVGTEKSIAVLPFVNMSNDPENEYFGDGIAEEILNALTRIEGIRVTARTSSFSFKGKNEDVRQIGMKLGVSAVLEGSVRKAGKKVRITAQLINTADGYHIWSETFDSDMEDIFQVQDEISLKILNRLKENFAPAKEHEPIIKAPTENIDAYNLYLKGLYHWNKSKPEEIDKAIKNFEEAVKIDPKYANAYCALSYCYSLKGSSGWMPIAEAYSKAKDFALKAIDLDSNNPNSHLSLGTIKFFHNWDFEGAEASLRKAIDLKLNSSLLNQVYGWFLIARGDCEKAIERMEEAVKQDPLSLPLLTNLADAYAFAGKFDEALVQYDKIIELDPTFRRAFEAKGMIYLGKKDFEKAIANLEKYHQMIGHPLKGLSSLGHCYAAAGYTDKANEVIQKLKKREELEPGVTLHLDYAVVYAGLKDHDKAFYYLNKAYEERMGIACLGMIYCVRYPAMLELKADPRFLDLISKMELKA